MAFLLTIGSFLQAFLLSGKVCKTTVSKINPTASNKASLPCLGHTALLHPLGWLKEVCQPASKTLLGDFAQPGQLITRLENCKVLVFLWV